MTQHHSFKTLVRARMARTWESCTAAVEHARLTDVVAADSARRAWRRRLDDVRDLLEGGAR